MLCEKCGKNEATVHYSEIINGKKTTYTLCAKCAEEMGIGASPLGGFDAHSLLSGFFGDVFSDKQIGRKTTPAPEKRCPVCSASLHEIAKEGKVGCSECYRTFRDELRSTIRRIHGGASYKGTPMPSAETPAASADPAADAPSPVSEADALRAELYEAIKSENFERAAELRDRIKSLGE